MNYMNPRYKNVVAYFKYYKLSIKGYVTNSFFGFSKCKTYSKLLKKTIISKIERLKL